MAESSRHRGQWAKAGELLATSRPTMLGEILACAQELCPAKVMQNRAFVAV
ncbi:hypothetical protein A2U01_0065132 [Trifolium medium]|uniref:Uncharacterized protein n=1 Tax=Trifolium medium TaxID=97028 RepID=A0A392S4Q8_9FABA|nr:hypothetical protein [Trifolium medium]